MLALDNVAWHPLPGTKGKRSSQEKAINAPVNDLLLTGGRGWGKTELQLMRFRRHVGRGYGTYWRGIIFDREYKNLDDLVVKSRRLFQMIDGPSARFLESNNSYKWQWETGEELLFRVVKKESDYWAYHGHEYPFYGFNELTKYPDGKLFRRMLSINRSGFDPIQHTPKLKGDNYVAEWNARHPNGHYLGRPFIEGDYETPDGRPLPPIPLENCSTTNPYGPGHTWVKQEFIDPAPYGRIIEKKQVVFNPKTKQDEEVTRRRVTVFGTYKENPYLSPEYIAGLHEETDENIFKAWVLGSWDIVAGGAFDDLWKKSVHVIPRFAIPAGWRVDRALDWGSAKPFAVGWFAECNGEEAILPDGTVFCPPRGTLIQIGEIYGAKKVGTNEGIKWTSTKVAEAIIEWEVEAMQAGWITTQPLRGPADNGISQVTDEATETVEKKMAAKGVRWDKSDKGQGSRKIGLELMRDRLEAALTGEGPALYFMDNCRASIATIPVLPRSEKDPEDIDSDAEDHAYDMVRYRCLKSSNRAAKVIQVRFSH